MCRFALCLVYPCCTLDQLWLSRFTEVRDLTAGGSAVCVDQ